MKQGTASKLDSGLSMFRQGNAQGPCFPVLEKTAKNCREMLCSPKKEILSQAATWMRLRT